MNYKEKKKFGWNIFFILSYIVFLLIFPLWRNYFMRNNIEISAPERVLMAADNSTNFVSSLFSNLGSYFFDKKILLSKIEDLEKDLEQERNKNVLFTREISATSTTDILPAKKIFSDFTTIYDTALLDKGARDGVEEKDLVFVYPNKVIGTIDRVYEKTSRTSLFSRDKSKIEGVLKIENVGDTAFEPEEITISTSSEIVSTSSTSSNYSTSSSSLNLNEITQNIEPSNVTKKSSSQIVIDIYGYGGGDYIARIPKNIQTSSGTEIFLASDEDYLLGTIVKITKPEASFYQILLIEGYYNTRSNDTFYIKKD